MSLGSELPVAPVRIRSGCGHTLAAQRTQQGTLPPHALCSRDHMRSTGRPRAMGNKRLNNKEMP